MFFRGGRGTRKWCQNHKNFEGKKYLNRYLKSVSPVILWFDLDKIATEIMFAANLSEKPFKQHIQIRPKSDLGKYDNLHK